MRRPTGLAVGLAATRDAHTRPPFGRYGCEPAMPGTHPPRPCAGSTGGGSPARPRIEPRRLGESLSFNCIEPIRPHALWDLITLAAAGRPGRLTAAPAPVQESDRGHPRSADRARHLVPAPRARLGAHARGRLRDFRGAARPPMTSCSSRSIRACIWCPATASGLPSCPWIRVGRYGSTTPTSTPLSRAPHGAAGPGGDDQLKRLAGRVFSQPLDRSRPLWELWLVEGLAGDRFALLSKTHHALVDGVSGVDIVTVLFDSSPDPMPVAPRTMNGCLGRCPRRPSCSPTRSWSARLSRPRSRGACGRSCAAPPGRGLAATAGQHRRDGLGGASAGAAAPVQRPDRATSPLHLGRRRPGPVQGDQERARRHGKRRRARPSPARLGSYMRCTAT